MNRCDDEGEGVLADAQGLCGDEAAALREGVGQTPLQGAEVNEAEAVEPAS